MFTLNFGARPRTESDYDNLRKTYERNLQHVREMQFTQRDGVYTESFLTSDSPRIKSMVATLAELGMK